MGQGPRDTYGGRSKGVDEISVRSMNGNDVDPGHHCSTSCLAVSFNDLKDLLFRHLARGRVVIVPGLCRRTLDLLGIAAELVRDQTKTQPWGAYAGFPPGMLQLNSDLLGLRMDQVDDPLQG